MSTTTSFITLDESSLNTRENSLESLFHSESFSDTKPSKMLTHKGESPYELYMNEHTDMEERPFAWPTDENPLAMPFEFPPSKSDVGGFGYDNLPEWLPPHNPPFGLDFAETDLYNTGMQSQYGEFNYFDGDTQRKPLPEMKDRSLERDRSSSTAQSSSKHGSKMPSLSQLKNRKAQKRFRERQKVRDLVVYTV